MWQCRPLAWHGGRGLPSQLSIGWRHVPLQDVGGTCTGEHGVGYGKLCHLEREHGLPALQVRAAAGSLPLCCALDCHRTARLPPLLYPTTRAARPAVGRSMCAHPGMHTPSPAGMSHPQQRGTPSPRASQVMQGIKAALDPLGIMNPGKLGSSPASFGSAARLDDL